MSSRTFHLPENVHNWLVHTTLREPELLRRLRAETSPLPKAGMQISPEQGQFMMLLIELLGARRALEIGTFTGYSALCVASALPADGRLICCDINREWTDIARRCFRAAGVESKIDLRLGPGLESLDELLRDRANRDFFDFAFIDADKTSYDAYYERCLQLVRRGGLVAMDNALWGGDVADPGVNDDDTVALRKICQKIATDARVTMSLVPIGDGLLLARKR
jgi:caffeoyl-CoA O-methyltransferase